MTIVSKKIAIVITAAGSSTRMGGGIKKEYMSLGSGTVLSNSIKAFVDAFNKIDNSYKISHLIITTPVNGTIGAAEAVTAFFGFDSEIQEKVEYVQGGYTRQRSVFNAITYLENHSVKPDYVLIHDGARPFVSERIILDVVDATLNYGASAPGITPTDTIKVINEEGFIVQHLERRLLTAIQTPQGFDFNKLAAAHHKASSDGKDYTDDTEIWSKYCGKVKYVEGDSKNIKITYPGDLERGISNA
ncbi:MAG: 2-C-methyl-D-erythritol 4-phosphate cytidylyltransferase [Treponema sp.]|nr:2-C-methyl-D-erythritol 4-phosphate cytidylyltransferase [Treponema sp.]